MKHVQHPENSGKGQSAPLPQPECPGEHCALWMALWDWDCLEIGEAPNDEEAAVLRPHYPAEPREGEAAPAGDVAKPHEIPDGWGWIVVRGAKLHTIKAAPVLQAQQITRPFLAALLRRADRALGDVGAAAQESLSEVTP